jgi:hypothetical protein
MDKYDSPSQPTANVIPAILTTHRDWDKWFGAIKAHAVQYGIWEYIDLDVEAPKELIEPTRPTPLTEAQWASEYKRYEYNERSKNYDRDHNRFKEDRQNLRNFRSAILRSVDTTQVSDLAADCLKPRDILLQLKERLCPATDTHINDLLARYDHLQKTPKTQDLEKWTRLWQQVVRDLKKVGEKTDTSAKRAYYFAAQKIDESLADQLWVRDRDISPKTSFDQFSNEFVSLIRSMRSNTELSSSRSSFATVTSEPTLHGESLDERSEGKKCLCGEIHKYKECKYIVPEIRPKNWKGDYKVLKEVNEKIDKSKYLKRIVDTIRKRFKDSDNPSDSSTIPGSRTKEPEDKPKNFSHLTVDLDADEDSELSCYTTILPKTLGLDVALSNQRSDFALQASWVVDNATHVHVGNNPDRFESIEPCHQILLTGDGTTVIEGYGVTYAMVQKPDGSTKKMRLHAAYIPNFHTNLISTILLRERGEIYLDEYTMQLQRKPNRECYAQLHTHYRMTVAEYNPIQYATLAAGSNFPTPPTPLVKKAGSTHTNTSKKGVPKSSDPRDPDLSIAARQRVDEIVEIVEIPEPQDGPCSYIENEISDLLEGTKFSTDGTDRTRSKHAEPTSEPTNQQLQTPESTPESIPPASVPTSGSDERSLEQVVDTNPGTFPNPPQFPSTVTFPGLSVPARGGGTTTVSADHHPDLIIEGPRTRQSTRRAAYNATLDGGRWHQNKIPPPPERWKDIKSHPLGPEFAAPLPNSSGVILAEKAPTSRSVGWKHGVKTTGSTNLQVKRRYRLLPMA